MFPSRSDSWITASHYGKLGLSDRLGRRPTPTTLSISFHILLSTSALFIRYSIVRLIVMAVVSAPPPNRSTKTESDWSSAEKYNLRLKKAMLIKQVLQFPGLPQSH